MKIKDTQKLKEFLTPYAEGVGVKIADIEFKQGKNPSLTIFIDKEGGVDLDTCEMFHNAVFDPIDEFDPTFDEPYTLNVSSRGADWAFKTDEDFISHIGKKVEVKLLNSVRGKKMYDGILLSYDTKSVTLRVDEKTTFTIDIKNLVKMNEFIDF